ncbi:MAG: Cystathionine beta-lyase MetC [Syntrophorhabdaceae bacterium PtaU1.Bin034]|nr:MAG: Cystathionine beta-lyase MetC [Syntrophorhabdaceae bacterium PtaU1.Bin034]
MDYRTKIIHTGKDKDPHTGASSIPVHHGSTFAQDDPIVFGQYEYARGSNPTRDALEHTIAVLEGGSQGFAFSSGMAAISSVLLLFKTGDHILVSEDVYGGTHRVLTKLFDRWGLRHTFADISTPDRIRKAIRSDTVAIFAETPSNPTLKITDLAGLVQVAGEKNLVTIIDNTFMSPFLQRPIEIGFDIVIHSATKFLGGHSDLIAGVVATKEKQWGQRLKAIQNAFGAILGPQDSWLLMRGIKTLAARMEVQQRNAEVIASWLSEQKEIERVYYPGLKTHPGRDVHFRQASGAGAVVSFELPSTEIAHAFLRSVTLPLLAVSLGGVESILSYPPTMSHAAVPPKERLARGITDKLVRLSVGLEDPHDLIDDFKQALEKAIKRT